MPDWVPNTVGLIGMLALAYPALAADRLAGHLASIDAAARHEDTDQAIKDLRDEIRGTPRSPWQPLHRRLLYGGYLCLLASYLLRFIP